MFKFIKYELKTYYKNYIGLFLISILLNSFLLYKQGDWMEGIGTALISLVTFGTALVVLIFSVMSFNKDLYEDRGYLTFTLPISSNKILLSKIITSIIWFSIAGIVTSIFQFITIRNLLPDEFLDMFNSLFNFNNIVISLVQGLITILFLLILIYFSITISRLSFGGKKFGKVMAFIFFILLIILYFYTAYKVTVAVPYTINFDIVSDFQYSINSVVVNTGLLRINVASSVFSLLFISSLYYFTWYFIDKKIDL